MIISVRLFIIITPLKGDVMNEVEVHQLPYLSEVGEESRILR